MDTIKIGKFIAQLRKSNNLTQEALGEKIGVTNKTVSRWENGNYMPDIEMLMILSETFGVSVNELLSGERLDETAFKEKAEENIIAALKESSFDRRERISFFKRKWLKDHLFGIILSALVLIGIFAWSLSAGETAIAAFCPAAGIAVFCIQNNRMMIYIENKIYGNYKT